VSLPFQRDRERAPAPKKAPSVTATPWQTGAAAVFTLKDIGVDSAGVPNTQVIVDEGTAVLPPAYVPPLAREETTTEFRAPEILDEETMPAVEIEKLRAPPAAPLTPHVSTAVSAAFSPSPASPPEPPRQAHEPPKKSPFRDDAPSQPMPLAPPPPPPVQKADVKQKIYGKLKR
jgi:hypothetical protein